MKRNRFFLVIAIAAMFCLVGWTVNAQMQKGTQTRQSWEYKNIVASGPHWIENGRPLGGNAEQLLWTKLQELGDQGWELISTSDC